MMPPLICFEIVAWHRPERVLRQIRLHQEVPSSYSYEQQLHRADASDNTRKIGRRIMLHTLPYGIRERVGSSLHPLWWVLLTHPHPLPAAGVPATPQKSPVVTSNN